jgi:hypothetical protein
VCVGVGCSEHALFGACHRLNVALLFGTFDADPVVSSYPE